MSAEVLGLTERQDSSQEALHDKQDQVALKEAQLKKVGARTATSGRRPKPGVCQVKADLVCPAGRCRRRQPALLVMECWGACVQLEAQYKGEKEKGDAERRARAAQVAAMEEALAHLRNGQGGDLADWDDKHKVKTRILVHLRVSFQKVTDGWEAGPARKSRAGKLQTMRQLRMVTLTREQGRGQPRQSVTRKNSAGAS